MATLKAIFGGTCYLLQHSTAWRSSSVMTRVRLQFSATQITSYTTATLFAVFNEGIKTPHANLALCPTRLLKLTASESCRLICKVLLDVTRKRFPNTLPLCTKRPPAISASVALSPMQLLAGCRGPAFSFLVFRFFPLFSSPVPLTRPARARSVRCILISLARDRSIPRGVRLGN